MASFALILVATLVTGACATQTGPRSQDAASGAATPDPRLATLTIGVSDEPQSFDPHVNVAGVSGARFYPNVYETLVQSAPDGSLKPTLAQSWTVSDGGKRYRFKLRAGVKFSDGAPFNADAVAASFTRFRTLNKGNVALFDPIVGVRSVDELTVDFVMSAPFAPMLSIFATWQGAIFVSPQAMKQNEKDGDLGQAWLKDHTAGTGPFVLESWEPNSRIVLVRTAHYREPKKTGGIERVIFRNVPEPSTLRQQLAGGDIDIAESLTPALIAPLRQAEGVRVSVDDAAFKQIPIMLNISKKPFADANFRRGLAYSVDYPRLLTVWNGIAEPSQGPFARSFAPWFSASDAFQYKLDAGQAAENFRKAGLAVPLSPRLKLRLAWQQGETAQRDMGTLVKEDLARVGIDVELVQQELPLWRKEIWDRTFDLTFVQAGLRFADPDAFATQRLHSSNFRPNGFNPGIVDPHVDELVDRGKTTDDVEKRREIYNEIQRIVTREALLIFLVDVKQAWARGTNVTGIAWNPFYGAFFNAHEITKTGSRQR